MRPPVGRPTERVPRAAGSLREFTKTLVVRDHRALQGGLHPLLLAFPHWLDDEPLPVGPHVQLGVAIDVQQLENGLLDDDTEAVPDGRELLPHTWLRSYVRITPVQALGKRSGPAGTCAHPGEHRRHSLCSAPATVGFGVLVADPRYLARALSGTRMAWEIR